jgi:ABC-type phosphate transport system substrate-binding protein
VHIDGSNGVMPLMRAIADAYLADSPDATVTFGNGLGSRTRIDSLRAGRMDIAIASHGLDTAALRAEGLMVHRIAVTPVVIGVHAASVSLSGLASAQLCDVLAGRATSWRQLGDGRDLRVAVVVRPESEVDMEVLRAEVPCAATLVISPSALVVEETADMEHALMNTDGALGITTSTVALQSEGAIRALTLDGVAPNDAAVRSGEYELVRSVYLVTRANPGNAVDALLRFIASERGRHVMAENGAIAR